MGIVTKQGLPPLVYHCFGTAFGDRSMKDLRSRLKPFLRWAILGIALFFLAKVFKENWQTVLAIRIDAAGWSCLAIALGVTLLAHITAGWVWSQILQDFRQPVERLWVIQAYLKTNIAKYLPGNVWHYYGRISAATSAGASLSAASISVLLEPLLMAAAALLVTVLCSQQLAVRYGFPVLALQWISLGAILSSVHPSVLNPIIQGLSRLKQQSTSTASPKSSLFQLDHYPVLPFLGEFSFLLLRGAGFLLTCRAVSAIAPSQVPILLAAFSLAWLLGLVVPGAPGGIGVFEAVAIALLGSTFSPAMILSATALYRVISILAEAMGAGLAWLDEQSSR
jgi:hypothetical protein